MSYTIDPIDGDIIIGGFQNGVADSPYSGLSNLQGVDIFSVPGEAPVAMSTTLASPSAIITAVTATFTASVATFTYPDSNSKMNNGQAVSFQSTVGNITANKVYWVQYANQTGGAYYFNLFSDYAMSTQVTPSSNGTSAFSTFNIATPKFFQTMGQGESGTNFMLDSSGQLWSDYATTNSSLTGTLWRYTGNTLGAGSNGNGLIYWRTTNSNTPGDWDGWLFIFRDGFVDYCNTNGVTGGSAYNHVGTFTYGWNIISGGTTGTANLTGQNVSACPHAGVVGPDGNMYFVDYFTTWKIQQTDIVTPVNFNPATNSTYITTHAHNLPINTISTCISPLGDSYLIGTAGNKIYVWNGVDQLNNTSTILLAENYVQNIVTVNTNAYIFCGDRGIIYVTNGSQANPWKKIPDHISGTIEPAYAWGGADYRDNRLYFSVYVYSRQDGSAISGYGGIWAADTQTNAMCLLQQLSYLSYEGYASALMAQPNRFVSTPNPTLPSGYGIIAGWVHSGTYGIDVPSSTPYTGGQTTITTDLIPIGTIYQPITPFQFEYKLSKPLLDNEQVILRVASSLNGTYTTVGTTNGSSSSTILSDQFPSPVQNLQWCVIKAVTLSSASNPSFCRITQIRLNRSAARVSGQTPYSLQ